MKKGLIKNMSISPYFATIQTPQEVTARLEESMRNSLIRTDKEEARKFLSMLTMYDSNGQLRKEY